MQALVCEVVRALMKLGMAIAANRPMMATTIMISTNVKPDLREVLMFILCFCLSRCGVNESTGGLIRLRCRSLIACCNRTGHQSKVDAIFENGELSPQKSKKPGRIPQAF